MIDFIQIGGPYGDGTSMYNVKLNKDFTVKEFIDYILKKYPENWGYISIADKDIVLSNQCVGWDRLSHITRNYINGNITLKNPNSSTLSKKVMAVKASGGRSRMDYIIGVEKENTNKLITMHGRLLLFDAQSVGVVFPKDCKINFPKLVPFIKNFDTLNPNSVIGSAQVYQDEKGLVCDVFVTGIDRDTLRNEFNDQLYIGGIYGDLDFEEKDGIKIFHSVTLYSISQTYCPADERMKIYLLKEE